MIRCKVGDILTSTRNLSHTLTKGKVYTIIKTEEIENIQKQWIVVDNGL